MSSSGKSSTMNVVGNVSALAILIIGLMALLFCFDPTASLATAKDNNSSQYFPQTNYTVSGKFLDY